MRFSRACTRVAALIVENDVCETILRPYDPSGPTRDRFLSRSRPRRAFGAPASGLTLRSPGRGGGEEAPPGTKLVGWAVWAGAGGPPGAPGRYP